MTRNTTGDGEVFLVRILGQIWRHRVQFYLSVPLVFLVAIGIAFWGIKKTYLSSVTFLPPAGNSGMPAFIQGDLGGMLGLSQESLGPEQIKAVIEGDDFANYMIRRFDLVKRYRIKSPVGAMTRARKSLSKKLVVNSMDNSGIGFTSIYALRIDVEDESADTARLMCEAAFRYVDSIVVWVSSSRARNSANFLRGYLASKETSLDSIQSQLTAFRKKNKLLDIGSQQDASVGAFTSIQSEILRMELDLAAVVASRGPQSAEAQLRRGTLVRLKDQYKNMEAQKNPALFLSVDRAASLFPKYVKLVREVEIENRAILLLRQQYESNRLEEVRTTSSLQIIDQPDKSDYKARPKRIMIVLLISIAGVGGHLAVFVYLLLARDVLRRSNLLARIREYGMN